MRLCISYIVVCYIIIFIIDIYDCIKKDKKILTYIFVSKTKMSLFVNIEKFKMLFIYPHAFVQVASGTHVIRVQHLLDFTRHHFKLFAVTRLTALVVIGIRNRVEMKFL